VKSLRQLDNKSDFYKPLFGVFTVPAVEDQRFRLSFQPDLSSVRAAESLRFLGNF